MDLDFVENVSLVGVLVIILTTKSWARCSVTVAAGKRCGWWYVVIDENRPIGTWIYMASAQDRHLASSPNIYSYRWCATATA